MTKKVSRRQFVKAAAATITAPMINLGSFKVFAATDKRYSARAIDLVNDTLTIDMLSILVDFTTMMGTAFGDQAATADAMAISDLQMRKIVDSATDVFHPAMGLSGYEDTLRFVARLNAYVADYPQRFRRIDCVADMAQVKSADRTGIIIGVQNSDHFRTLKDINQFYHLGQRVSQLTYNSQNLIGSGATDLVDGGVSTYGSQVIGRMNELGMAIDVSHCGDRTSLDAFEHSTKPVLITHSNVRALANGHPRCKSDEVIQSMAKHGGVMGITGVRQFVSHKEPTGLNELLDHFDYVANLVGVEHVGIGSDMDPDGYDDLPKEISDRLRSLYTSSYAFREKTDTDDFDHPKRIFDLTDGLISRGYSDENIRMILGGNFERVLKEIWGG